MEALINNSVSESRFYMWRAVVAMAHADGIVDIDEVDYLSNCFKGEPFSSGQLQILTRDLVEPQNIEMLFSNISEEQDEADFFTYAEELSGSDGDFCKREREVYDRLMKKAKFSGKQN